MSVLKFIKDILGYPDESRHDYVASTLSSPELDIETMQRRMRLKEEGPRRGACNKPVTYSESRDDIEPQIMTMIESEKRLAHEKYIDHLRTYGDCIASLGFQIRFT